MLEYVLIDPSSGLVDLFRKDELGRWVLHPSAGKDAFEFASIGLTVVLADIFEDVELGNSARVPATDSSPAH